ncbi:MAG: ATP-binding cassette domain-containing protein [Planctomycetes bacterium]|nr:ATP-binding cassette domain-containing protein [Planctomycetota bacterium]
MFELRDARVRYPGALEPALEGLSLDLDRAEFLAVAGESGSGKSTLLRVLARHVPLESGSLAVHTQRHRLQLVFQDPYASLDPRQRAGAALAEVLRVHGLARTPAELLAEVGLDAALAQRFPHELSGGERQRLAIARALSVEPLGLLLDEPVSALDPSHRAQVLNLLVDLRERRGLACLLVTHDLALVRVLADRLAVLERGRLVECGDAQELLSRPAQAATRRLVEAAGL